MKFWYYEDEENIIKYIHLITLSLNLKELNKEDYFVSSISREKDLEMIANTERDICFEQGIEQWIFETAKNLIKIDLPLNKISEATGLSISELKKIKTTIL